MLDGDGAQRKRSELRRTSDERGCTTRDAVATSNACKRASEAVAPCVSRPANGLSKDYFCTCFDTTAKQGRAQTAWYRGRFAGTGACNICGNGAFSLLLIVFDERFCPQC
jgi:hypothetical protein